MKKRRWFAVAIGLLTLLSATACGTPSESSQLPPESSSEEPAFPVVSQTQLFGELKGSVYSSALACEEFSGLSDIEKVGVSETEFSKTLYPVPADSEFAEIRDVTEYGLSADAADNAPALQRLLEDLKGIGGLKQLYFPAGVYRFGQTVSFSGISDLWFVGEEVTEWMMTEWVSAVKLNGCTDIHFNNIDFDYLISPSVSGTVTAADESARTISIRIFDEFDLTDHHYNNGTILYGNYMEYVYDEEFDCYYPDANGMLRYNSTGDRVNMISGGSYDEATKTLTLTFSTVQPFVKPEIGKMASAAFTMYEYTTFLVDECKNFYMEDCNIYASAGMAMTCESTENLYFNDTNYCLREGSRRLMTATADCLHAIDCYGDLFVTNSLFENSHDDSINICSFYKTVTSNFARELVCTSASNSTDYPIEEGDVIEIFDKATMALYGSYTVTGVRRVGLVSTLTLDKRINDSLNGYLVGNVTRVPELKVNNCVFRNKRNRGILAQVRNSQITNNTFLNVVHGAISVHSVMDIFAEAIVPRDFVISGNKFIRNNTGRGLAGDVAVFCSGTGGTTAGTITGIEVFNNFFYGGNNAGVSFTGTGDCLIRNNLFLDGSRTGTAAGVSLNLALDTVIEDNLFYMTEQKTGFAAVSETNSSGTGQSGNVKHNVD